MADPYINAERAHRFIVDSVTTANVNKLSEPDAVRVYQLAQRERYVWAQLVELRQKQRTPADWRTVLPIWETWGNAASNLGSLLTRVTVAGQSIQKESGKAMRAARAAAREEEKTATDVARDVGVWLGLVALGLGVVAAVRRGPGEGWR